MGEIDIMSSNMDDWSLQATSKHFSPVFYGFFWCRTLPTVAGRAAILPGDFRQTTPGELCMIAVCSKHGEDMRRHSMTASWFHGVLVGCSLILWTKGVRWF